MDSNLEKPGVGDELECQDCPSEDNSLKSPLPHESVPLLLEMLGAHSLAMFRRSCRLNNLSKEAHIAELRALVLDLLCLTKFPFTHAAFVLGLNGPYYSYDTVAANHYGIPEALPRVLCRLFRLAVPGVEFTTIRMQKLAAGANFGGKHRTLAFNLAPPPAQQGALRRVETGTADEANDVQLVPPSPNLLEADAAQNMHCATSENASETQGYALFLTTGCRGGHGDVCNVPKVDPWRVLAVPSHNAKWVPFPRTAWLQWHWPLSGDLYAVTVTCEPAMHREFLSLRERRRMASMGFLLPEFEQVDSGAVDEDSSAAEHAADDVVEENSPSSPVRRSAAALEAAREIFGFEESARPSIAEIEEAFRQHVRMVHPDRGGETHGSTAGSVPTTGAITVTREEPHELPWRGTAADEIAERRSLAGRTRGWAMSRVTWARKVLRDASSAGWWEGTIQEQARDGGEETVFMLAAPARLDEEGAGEQGGEDQN